MNVGYLRVSKLILMRHGQSCWNELDLFTGWVNVPLSSRGMQEAVEGGKLISQLPIDAIFVSSLMRAQQTAMLAMLQHSSGRVPAIQPSSQEHLEEWFQIHSEETRKEIVPVYCAWQLNERMYGELQGLNKTETVEKYGKEQVQIWRRSFEVAPPGGESLEMTSARAVPYFKNYILPALKNGMNIFIAAHGNSLRAIIMFLSHLSKEEVVQLELTTGTPIIYDYQDPHFIQQ
jgi:2,3-bisphosphoglycerate-dependent phosphoglycerate mutase